jgi:dynactin complex subunit
MKNNKIKKELKRSTALILAFLLASTCSLAVYATVSYDSSQDPVVSLSGMQAYVSEKIDELKTTVSELDLRVQALELAYSTGGAPSTGGNSNTSSEALQALLDRISALEAKTSELEQSNSSLKNDLNSTKEELGDIIAELESQYATLASELEALSSQLSKLQGQFTSLKGDVSTLSNDFKQLSTISTKLNTLTNKVNTLTSESGDIGKLKAQCAQLQADMNEVLLKAGTLYKPVFVPYGATIRALEAEDSVLVVLRSGSAVAISPFTTPGTAQGLNDLSDGSELYDGDNLILFHNILIPRGGEDGRGVTITSLDGAYVMIGGNYVIIQP